MDTLIVKLVLGQEVEPEEVEAELYEICDREHSQCNVGCPVYEVNGGPVNPDRPFRENRGCDCFKSGQKMAEFIRANRELRK